MAKLTDMIISGIIKRGILYEARNCDIEIDIPMEQGEDQIDEPESKIRVRFKAEHMSLRVEKD
jgi:hypothetical protein